jgi:methylase of polypeptide subunit release factors
MLPPTETRFAPSAPTVESLAATLSRAGVAAMLLRHRRLAQGGHDVELLLRPEQSRLATGALEDSPWLYVLGDRGAWRLFPMRHYWWAGGFTLAIYWRLPAAPLPSVVLRPLERALWEGATPSPIGFLTPDPEALLVHRACQAARPDARYHEGDWLDFLDLLPRVTNWNRVWDVARANRVTSVVQESVEAARRGQRPHGRPVFDGILRLPWLVATAPQRRMGSTTLTRYLGARPRLGELTARCRVNGTEVLSGPGVFVPTPDAELFVQLTLERLQGRPAPVVAEIGTGCGAIGLAIARARPDAQVHLTDLSHAAVRWARRSQQMLGLRNATVLQGSLLEPLGKDLTGKIDVLLANLPFYPPRDYAAIGNVPRDTIQGAGDDGLGLVRQTILGAASLLAPGGTLLLQMFDWQWERLRPELVAAGLAPAEPVRSGPFAIGRADLRTTAPAQEDTERTERTD